MSQQFSSTLLSILYHTDTNCLIKLKFPIKRQITNAYSIRLVSKSTNIIIIVVFKGSGNEISKCFRQAIHKQIFANVEIFTRVTVCMRRLNRLTVSHTEHFTYKPSKIKPENIQEYVNRSRRSSISVTRFIFDVFQVHVLSSPFSLPFCFHKGRASLRFR